MAKPRDPASPRRLIEQFAAHMAHLLNTSAGETASIVPYKLYQSLTRTLAGSSYQRLTGFSLAGPETSAGQAAEGYFDAVLDRRLFLKGNEQSHKGHGLFLALCQRGMAEGWSEAALERKAVSRRAGSCPRDFPAVAERLAKLDHSVTPGNPAVTTQAKCGPLVLVAGSGGAITPEELSVWKGISSAPEHLRKLSPGKEFDAFCSLAIKAVEAANAPFGAVVALGLSPRDWAGELTTNTAKKLGALLSDVREAAGGHGIGDLAIWRHVWEQRQVPGYASADEFWDSPLGRAIRFPVVPRAFEFTGLDGDIEGEIIQQGELMADDQEFAVQLADAKREGVVDDFDVWLLGAVRERATLAELQPSSQVRLRLGRNGDLGAYFDELTERLLRWGRDRLAAGHPDNDGDTADDD